MASDFVPGRAVPAVGRLQGHPNGWPARDTRAYALLFRGGCAGLADFPRKLHSTGA
jgi:hypothetical protein